jgi:hypothetical protein
MPDTKTKAALLDGLMTGHEVEAELGWRPHTRRRRERQGLPYIQIGNAKLYPRAELRAWIWQQKREDHPR